MVIPIKTNKLIALSYLLSFNINDALNNPIKENKIALGNPKPENLKR